MQFIDLKQQYLDHKKAIDEAIFRVLDHGQYILGPEVAMLEEQLASYIDVKHCITAASGTDTLMMALLALGVGPGDEVITSPFTFIAPAEVIALVGARIVYADIDPKTYCLDVTHVEAAITPKTKAIIPVSLFGQMADLTRLNQIAARFGIPVIEDAAQSFGASHGGKKSGACSVISSTSFYPAKPLGCYGDGGALFTSDDALAERMRSIRVHGASATARYHHTCLGFNGRFDTIQAAIMLAKFPHFPGEVATRMRLAAYYDANLQDVCTTPFIAPGNDHVYAQYTIRVPQRNAFVDILRARGVPTAIHYPRCLHQQPVFESLGYAEGAFPHAEQAAGEVISLPMHPYLTQQQQDQVIAAVKQALFTLSVENGAQTIVVNA